MADGAQAEQDDALGRLPGYQDAGAVQLRLRQGVKRSQVEDLAGLGFIERNENVVLVGPAALARPTWRLRWAIRPHRPVLRRA